MAKAKKEEVVEKTTDQAVETKGATEDGKLKVKKKKPSMNYLKKKKQLKIKKLKKLKKRMERQLKLLKKLVLIFQKIFKKS